MRPVKFEPSDTMKTIFKPQSSILAVALTAFTLTSVLCPLASGNATTFTSSTTISETNTNYDGQDIVISGARVTMAIADTHAFNPFLLTNGPVLTHSPCTASAALEFDLDLTEAVTFSSIHHN